MQWHSLQSCVQTRTRRWRALPHRRSQNPNPAALLAFLRASPPLCSPRCLRAAVAAPCAAFGAFVRSSPPSCGPPSSPPHTGLGPVVLQGPLLAAALPGCRPLLQSSLHLQEDAVWGGAPVEDRIVVKYNLRNMCRIYVSLIMAPVRQFICVTEW